MNRRPIKMLVLSMTGQCNFACRYCYAAEHDKSLLSSELIRKAIQLVIENNTDADTKEVSPFILQFSGGEPLLNWQGIEAAIEYVEMVKAPAQLQIQTNGALLTDEIAKYLYKHKIGIGISLDGRPKVNDKNRLCKDGTSATLATIKGIEVLKRNNIACGLTCVVTNDNVAQLDEIVEFAYFLGNIRKIGFDLLRQQGRGEPLTFPAPELLKESLDRVYKKNKIFAEAFGYIIGFTQREKCRQLQTSRTTNPFSHCSAMTREAIFVDAKGYIYSCASFIGNDEFFLGTVNTGIREELSYLINNRITKAMKFCNSCKLLEHCGGGCLARWYNRNGFVKYTSECVLKTMFRDY